MGIFDGLPVSRDKEYLREEISRIDESWAAARFDSLPHVVHILTSKDRESEVEFLKQQSDVVEEVVDEVVHNYHSGFNKAIQNYSQILRLFSESTENIGVLKVDLAEAKRRLSSRNKQLHQLWYRSVTLRHIISLLDQIEGISKVPARIEKLISEKQYYAAVQFHVQSMLMLEREGLQTVGALQDVRSELTKLRGVLFYKVLEDLHAHLYNKGEYSSAALSLHEREDEVPTTTAVVFSMSNSQSLSRRTRLLKGDNQLGIHGDGSYRAGSVDGGSSVDGPDEEGTELHDEATSDGHSTSARANGDVKIIPRQMPTWLQYSTPDEFLETIKKSDAPLHVKYLQTMVECLCMLRKVAAAGAMICQRLRPTLHDIITSKIKTHAELVNSSRSGIGQAARTATPGLHFMKGQLESYQLPKHKRQNGISLAGTLLAASPVSPVMAPAGKAQAAAKDLVNSILDAVVRIFENHVVVGELLELKSSQQADMNTPKSLPTDININPDSESSQVTGGYSIGFSLTVLQSECQQLICEILRATPEAASADAAVQTARFASKAPSKDKRDSSEEGLTFAFRFTDATISIPNQGVDLIRQGWSRKGPNVLQEGYGSAAVLPEQGIYLAASVYRPVIQFTDKVASMLPKKYSQLSNDGLLAFVENFVKDHFLPTMFVDYRKGVQQAISSPASFRPRAHAAASYTPSIEKGRPVLQGLLAIDFLAKEVLGWAQAMPKFAGDLAKYVQTFLERTYERCRTSYMEAVLEKQSYMLIGRHDIEQLMRLDPASAYLPNAFGQSNMETHASDAENFEVELELSELLLNLRPIKQDNLIRDDNKLILLASLSDSLEYVAESIERLGETTFNAPNQVEDNGKNRHRRTSSAPARDLASFADEYRKLAIDCLKVLRVEMQLETIFHMQEMTNREYMEDQDAEEPDDFIISLTAQITRRDEEMAPFVSALKRNYIFGGICSVAANASIRALADMKCINLFGVQQICRNSIALEQALAAIPAIDSEGVQQRLDHVRTYYELLNMPFEAVLAFITEHEHLFTAAEYANLLKVQVPGREIPADAKDRVSEILSR
ncbi:putative Sec8 exocyst complex component specific domain-containing protein [Rosa chinensis]|uniref:Exocyst complex component Sec8 n=1 Tax=Rosa chinensis TaxID=74649 RepID=A0A2P6SJ83_ROSCH|nr:exocyst complex component SEC8 [Rosa chinensis]XP_024176578.1 exocyst complex component SEC8 [Rosa chinensis]PRQ58738.1 putative Sec8 exocyst complex component specific domain-containing protein [Rosa chinensis]